MTGRVVSEATKTGKKRYTYVAAGGQTIARQELTDTNTEIVGWQEQEKGRPKGQPLSDRSQKANILTNLQHWITKQHPREAHVAAARDDLLSIANEVANPRNIANADLLEKPLPHNELYVRRCFTA